MNRPQRTKLTKCHSSFSPMEQETDSCVIKIQTGNKPLVKLVSRISLTLAADYAECFFKITATFKRPPIKKKNFVRSQRNPKVTFQEADTFRSYKLQMLGHCEAFDGGFEQESVASKRMK